MNPAIRSAVSAVFSSRRRVHGAFRRRRRSISPASGRRASGRTSRSACPVRSSATISAFRSATPRVCAPSPGTPRFRRCPNGSAVRTRPTTSGAGRRTCASRRRSIRSRARSTAFHAEWLRSVDRAIYLDGRPHPPADALHTWAGFSTAKWDGDMLTVTVDASEGRLPAPQRAAAQRQGDADRALDPQRRLPDGDDDRQRPGLPDRAVRPHDRLRAGPAPAGAAVSVRRRAGSRSREGRDAALPARRQSVHDRVRDAAQDPGRRDARRGGDDVSGLPAAEAPSRTPPPSRDPRRRQAARAAVRRDSRSAQQASLRRSLPVRGNIYMLLGRRRQHHRVGRARRRADGRYRPARR